MKLPFAENESRFAPCCFCTTILITCGKNRKMSCWPKSFCPQAKSSSKKKNGAQQLQKFILPLAKDYNVQFNNVKREEIKDLKPEVKLMLKEKGDYLLFQPVFNYKGYEVKPQDKEKIIIPQQDRLLVIQRNQ